MFNSKLEGNIRAIWRQSEVAVLAQRAETNELFVKLPNPEDHPVWRHRQGLWLRQVSPRGRIPKWSKQYGGWQIPKIWLTRLSKVLLERYGECFIIQPYRTSKTCAPNCRKAKGLDCDCSCMGEYHGVGGPNADWFVVSDTFAVMWGEIELGCRHLKSR